MVLKTFTNTKPQNSEKRVVEIKQTKLKSHYKQIKTSECWKPWQEGSKSNAANYSLWVENYIFWKSSSHNAHPLETLRGKWNVSSRAAALTHASQPVAGAQCASSVCNQSPLSSSSAPSVGVAAWLCGYSGWCRTQSMPIVRRAAARPQSPHRNQLGDT